jgi:DNA-binding transcriptional ArsR family regulator
MGNNKSTVLHQHAPRRSANLPDASELQQASAMFRALGDPARLRLLARLAGGEVCVTELADLEEEKLTTVSARLQILHDAPCQTATRGKARLLYTHRQTRSAIGAKRDRARRRKAVTDSPG